jgi:hypothetical protein
MNRAGVNVPGIRMVDATDGILGLEWIEGRSIRHLLPDGAEREGGLESEGTDDVGEHGDVRSGEIVEIGNLKDPLSEYSVSVGVSTSNSNFLRVVGRAYFFYPVGSGYTNRHANGSHRN